MIFGPFRVLGMGYMKIPLNNHSGGAQVGHSNDIDDEEKSVCQIKSRVT